MSRRAVRWVPVFAVLGVLVVVLFTGLPGFGGEAATYPEVCPVAKAPSTPTPQPKPYAPDGADYAGPGPHPLIVLDTLDPWYRLRDGTPLHARMAVADGPDPFDYPAAWQSKELQDTVGGDVHDQDRSEVQLVACVYYDALGPAAAWCNYEGDDKGFGLVPVQLTVVVREATTGRTVRSFPLRSDPPAMGGPASDLPGEHCPGSIPVAETNGAHTWIVPPRNADFLAGLRPLVERNF